jgi:hypothetical protein
MGEQMLPLTMKGWFVMKLFERGMSCEVAIEEDDIQLSLWGNNIGCFMLLTEELGVEKDRDYFFNLEDLLDECKYNNPLRRMVEILLGGEHKITKDN